MSETMADKYPERMAQRQATDQDPLEHMDRHSERQGHEFVDIFEATYRSGRILRMERRGYRVWKIVERVEG